jgi:amino acid permease
VTAQSSPATPATKLGFRRDVGTVGLLFVSVGSIIGSGWLFGSLYASQEAGPAALISWGLGAVFMLALALIHAELGGAHLHPMMDEPETDEGRVEDEALTRAQ